jgi:hypothetical protein
MQLNDANEEGMLFDVVTCCACSETALSAKELEVFEADGILTLLRAAAGRAMAQRNAFLAARREPAAALEASDGEEAACGEAAPFPPSLSTAAAAPSATVLASASPASAELFLEPSAPAFAPAAASAEPAEPASEEPVSAETASAPALAAAPAAAAVVAAAAAAAAAAASDSAEPAPLARADVPRLLRYFWKASLVRGVQGKYQGELGYVLHTGVQEVELDGATVGQPFVSVLWYEEQDIRKPKDECKVMLPVMSGEDDFTFDRLPIAPVCALQVTEASPFFAGAKVSCKACYAPLMMPRLRAVTCSIFFLVK